jgi:hypothetical protein
VPFAQRSNHSSPPHHHTHHYQHSAPSTLFFFQPVSSHGFLHPFHHEHHQHQQQQRTHVPAAPENPLVTPALHLDSSSSSSKPVYSNSVFPVRDQAVTAFSKQQQEIISIQIKSSRA